MTTNEAVARPIVTTFVKQEAGRFQGGRITAKGMMPAAAKAPVSLDWVYLERSVTTDEEIHPVNKIFTIVAGAATVVAGYERLQVRPGDVVFVPSNMPHHFETTDSEPLELTVTKWA